jgi:hypothetical protein
MSDRLIGETVDANGVTCELYEPTDRDVDIFCEGVQGLQVRGPNVKFNLFRVIPDLTEDDPKKPKVERRLVTARVIMGVDTFLSVTDWLHKNADDIRGRVEIVPIDPGEKSH